MSDTEEAYALTVKLMNRRKRTIDIGKALYGDRYTKALAEGMGVSQVLVSHVSLGRRVATEDFERALLKHAEEVIESRKEQLLKAIGHISAMRQELGTTPAPDPDPDIEDDGPAPSM